MRKMFLKTVALLMCIVLLLTGCNADDFKDEVIEINDSGDPSTSEQIRIRFDHSIYSLDEEIYFTLSFGMSESSGRWGLGDFGKAALYWYIDGVYHFIRETEEDFTEENFGIAPGEIYRHSEQLRLPTELLSEGVGTVFIEFFVSKNGGLEELKPSEYGYLMKAEQFGYRKEGNTIKLARDAWRLEDKESN